MIDDIKVEIEKPRPNSHKVLKYLSNLTDKVKSQQLSDSEFFTAVGETFVSNPEFFMKEVYKIFRARLVKIVGVEKRREMDRSIIVNYCLYDGEQILFEGDGDIRQKVGGFTLSDTILGTGVYSRVRGRLYVTNNRVIAQGKLGDVNATEISLINKILDGGKSMKFVVDSSLHQELPCYGYNFEINCQLRIIKKRQLILPFIGLWVIVDNREDTSKLPKVEELREAPRYLMIMLNDKMKMNTLYEIMRNNVNDVFKIIKNQLEKAHPLDYLILNLLNSLRLSDKVQRFTDSEYIYILRETYKLNPEFFMTTIYPEMKSWNSSSFLSLKKELFEILRNEGADIDIINEEKNIGIIKEEKSINLSRDRLRAP
ncbi:MAG: hypothetical protein ACFE96_02705 [Candidatus Hermodarchaeota archaeon]